MVKWNDRNCLEWSAAVKLWFMGHRQEEHLTEDVSKIDDSKKDAWKKPDARLCNLLRHSLDPSLMASFHRFQTYKAVWMHVRESHARNATTIYVLSCLFQLKLAKTEMHIYYMSCAPFFLNLINLYHTLHQRATGTER